MSGTLGSIMLGLIKAKEMQFLHFFNSDQDNLYIVSCS